MNSSIVACVAIYGSNVKWKWEISVNDLSGKCVIREALIPAPPPVTMNALCVLAALCADRLTTCAQRVPLRATTAGC